MISSNSPIVILLAEDEPADVELVRRALSRNTANIELHHVPNGREALEFLCRNGPRYTNSPRPHMILLDLNMPLVNGGQLLQAIRQIDNLHDVPTLVMTASESERDARIALRLGASDFITKSMDAVKYMNDVSRICERWTAHRLPVTPRPKTEQER